MFNSFIKNGLNDLLNYEIGFDAALIEFEVDNMDDLISMETKWVEGIRQKFSELMFIDRMIHITGMQSFRDDILISYTQTMFNKPNNKQTKLKDLLDSVQQKNIKK